MAVRDGPLIDIGKDVGQNITFSALEPMVRMYSCPLAGLLTLMP